MMNEKELSKKASLSERLVEKFLEWFDYLRYGIFNKNKVWSSHLTEYYCIHRRYYEESFVKDFIKERKQILDRNSHRMVVNVIPDDCDDCIVGKVLLYNRSKYIHEATLKIRKPFTGNNIIFWSFEKEK